MPERSEDFKIINHILSKRYGFTQVGTVDSTRIFFQNQSGIKTHFIDREDSFTNRNLIELCDQIKVNPDELMNPRPLREIISLRSVSASSKPN